MNPAHDYEAHLSKLPTIGSTDDQPLRPRPCVKIFTPDGPATWFLCEYDPDTGETFGLCDLGLGFPELGYGPTLEDFTLLRGKLLGGTGQDCRCHVRDRDGADGLPPEVDLWWRNKTMGHGMAEVGYSWNGD